MTSMQLRSNEFSSIVISVGLNVYTDEDTAQGDELAPLSMSQPHESGRPRLI